MDKAPTTTSKWLLLVLWQLTWVVAVAGASHDLSLPGLLAGVLTFAVFVFLFRKDKSTIATAAVIATAGCLLDFALLSLGVMQAQGQPQNLPLWLIGLWMAFATAPSSALYWLTNKYVWQVLFGGTGGLLAWWSASNLGAVSLSTTAWWALPLAWALFTPGAYALQQWSANRSARLSGLVEPRQ
jgi:hypothetical protein